LAAKKRKGRKTVTLCILRIFAAISFLSHLK